LIAAIKNVQVLNVLNVRFMVILFVMVAINVQDAMVVEFLVELMKIVFVLHYLSGIIE